ncbi:MAG: hypothetical protein ACREN3_09175 [Gemmatimonadaceae bacterium]
MASAVSEDGEILKMSGPIHNTRNATLDAVGPGTIPVRAAKRALVFDGQLNPAFLRQIVLTIDLATGAWAERTADEGSSESDRLDIIQLEPEWLATRVCVVLDSILGGDFLHPVSPGVVIDTRANIGQHRAKLHGTALHILKTRPSGNQSMPDRLAGTSVVPGLTTSLTLACRGGSHRSAPRPGVDRRPVSHKIIRVLGTGSAQDRVRA